MKEQEGKSIYDFESGDILTRVKPCFYGYEDDMSMSEDGTLTKQKIEDFSYRGEPMKFLGIANNMIYFEVTSFGKPSTISLEIERWLDGWDIWIDPTIYFNLNVNP